MYIQKESDYCRALAPAYTNMFRQSPTLHFRIPQAFKKYKRTKKFCRIDGFANHRCGSPSVLTYFQKISAANICLPDQERLSHQPQHCLCQKIIGINQIRLPVPGAVVIHFAILDNGISLRIPVAAFFCDPFHHPLSMFPVEAFFFLPHMFCDLQKAAGGAQSCGCVQICRLCRLSVIAQRHVICQSRVGDDVMSRLFRRVQIVRIPGVAVAQGKSIENPGLTSGPG